jgi:hypothetical protein
MALHRADSPPASDLLVILDGPPGIGLVEGIRNVRGVASEAAQLLKDGCGSHGPGGTPMRTIGRAQSFSLEDQRKIMVENAGTLTFGSSVARP